MTKSETSDQKPAVFLDRDGTLIVNRGYSNDPGQIAWYPRLFGCLREIQRLGFKLVVVSNQSAVARGYCLCEDVDRFNRILKERLFSEKIDISGFFYSPFHPQGSVVPFNRDHESRKPAPGMLLAAAKQFNLDLNRSWMVGDSAADIGAGCKAGCRTVLLLTGHGQQTLLQVLGGETPQPHAVAGHVGDLARLLRRWTNGEIQTI